jgi:chromosomal replication initiator protein
MSMDDKQSFRSNSGFPAASVGIGGTASSSGMSKGMQNKTALSPTSRLVKDEPATSLIATSGNAALSGTDFDEAWRRSKTKLRAIVGEDVYSSWFNSTEFERFDGSVLTVSAPTKFLKNWVQSHYSKALFDACSSEFSDLERVNVMLRQIGNAAQKSTIAQQGANQAGGQAGNLSEHAGGFTAKSSNTIPASWPRGNAGLAASHAASSGPFEGSPLDPRYTFENFVVGSANRLAHAAAKQVAETVVEQPLRFNPLYIHSSVGLGKTHLLHAIAWEVKRRNPHASVLYLTAERFRYHFVGAVMAQDPLTFKDKFRSVDLLLIDDLEFMQGPKTEEEFDHTLNMLLDAGRQVVVASSRAPVHLESLDARMRSRLGGGLVTEVSGLDYEMRLSILERRVAEKRSQDPSFEIGRDVLEFLASKLTESGRELDGAVTRLYAACHYIGEPITVESAEHIIRDLMHGTEPRRIKIEDILRVVSKHFAVSRGDILSQRRHRSVVWPRQIGMYLAKQLTTRSLPEIGRRFGGRDHTTVLHAIRKIDGELKASTKLRDEIEDLKRLLNTN